MAIYTVANLGDTYNTTLSLAITGNTTLNSTQAENAGFIFTGSLSGTATITWPNFQGLGSIYNDTTGGYSLICGISGDTITVLPGTIVVFVSDGTNFFGTANYGNLYANSTITWSGGATPANSPLYVVDSVSGTATSASLPIFSQGYTAPLSLISVTSDELDASDTGLGGDTTVVSALCVSHEFGGSSSTKGSRVALSVNMDQHLTGNATEPTSNAYYIGVQSTSRSQGNDGGVLGTPNGFLAPFSGQTSLASTSTYWSDVFSVGEFDLFVPTGASVGNKVGLLLQLGATDAVQGSNLDTALWFFNSGSTTWKNLITLGGGQSGGSNIVSGYLLTAPQSGTMLGGFDLSNLTFTNFALKTSGALLTSNTMVVGQNTGVIAGVTLQAHTAANQNFTVSGPGALANGITLESLNDAANSFEDMQISAATLLLSATTLQLSAGQFTANGTTSVSLTSVAPSAAHATVQEWLTITDNNGNVRYIPCF